MKTYSTIQGDTWDLIAFHQWGNEFYTPLLLEANPRYLDVVVFPSDVSLNIPDLPPNSRQKGSTAPWRVQDEQP